MYTIDFSGKVVAVVGAGTGIGAAIARGFNEAGADLSISYQSSKEGAEQVAAEVQSAGHRCLLRAADARRSAEVVRQSGRENSARLATALRPAASPGQHHLVPQVRLQPLLQHARLGAIDGSLHLGFDFVSNLAAEFWPDVKHKILRRKL